MAASDAKPVPQKNVAQRITFTIFDNDGDPVTGATGLDSEKSLDGGAFGDCTNEATEIGNGVYYLDLTAGEMNADTVAIAVKTTSVNAKQTNIVMYPEESGDIRAILHAAGLDTITNTDVDQAAVTAGLTFRQKVLWLFQRFGYLHKRNVGASTLTVAKGDGVTCSTQTISDSGGIQQVGKIA